MKEKKQLLRILFLEENEQSIRLVESILQDSLPDYTLKIAKTEKEFLKFVIRFQPDVILSGYQLEKYSASEAFQLLRHEQYQIPFIIITDKLSEELANELIKTGVEDCVFRLNLTRLPQAIMKAHEKKKISSLKETAENLFKNERERLQTIFKNNTEAIINVGFKGEILEINPTGLDMLQLKTDKISERKNIFEFIHPEDRKRYKKFHNSVGIGNRKKDRFKIIGSKNEERWVETNAVPLFNEEDHIASVLTMHRDITEQYKAEELIHYHAKLFENITDAVISCDSDFHILSWNKGAERIYGWKEKEAIGKKMTELISNESTNYPGEEIIQSLASSGHWDGELNVFRKDGKPLTVLASSSVLKNEGKKISELISIHRDITKRKLVENELRKSQFQLIAAQEIANLGYWERDMETEMGIWSDQMNKIFERNESDQPPTLEEFLNYVHPDDKESLVLVRKELDLATDRVTHRYRIILKDGRIKHLLAFSQILKNEKGGAYKLIGTVMDITDFVMAKENALVSELKFKELFDNSPDAIYLEDENGIILDANKVACTLQGFSKEELLGKNVLDLSPEEYKLDFSSRYQILFNQKEAIIESVVWDRNQNATPVEIKSNRINFNGTQAVLVHARDISKRKAAEKAKWETDQKLDALSDQAPVGIYFVKKEGNIVECNSKFLEIFELSMEEVKAGEWMNRIHPEDAERHNAHRKETLPTDRKIEVQYKLLVNGKVKYILLTSNPMFDEEGIQIGRIGTIQDISEIGKVKEKMMLTQTMFQNLFEHSPDSIFIEDLEGNILKANSKACKLQGLDYEVLIGKNIRDLVPARDHEALMRSHKDLCEGKINRMKASIWNKEGKNVPVEIRANLINYFNSVALLLHVSTIED